MAKRLVLRPTDFECSLAECPPGLFLSGKEVCLKTEYGGNEAFCDSGEAFWGGTSTAEDKARVMVIPLAAVWEEVE